MLVAMESDDGNEALDSSFQQTIGKDHVVSVSSAGDSPIQWIQFLRALDQQELPGWPLVTWKVQMQKCEKCPREFCSLVNYRRHVRMHRRSLIIDKESHKIRDMLAAFWDKLSLEEVKEVVAFKDVMLKEISGASVIKEWATSICKPEIWALPQAYVKAGSTLLDIINAKPFRLPISSQELLCILDDASEGTFLCAGTAESVQKYVFDGEVVKAALEIKNLVACVSFLFEQNLVKAWLIDKDAEALRCQKLLMEEEEAAQRRQAELLQRRKQKKLRVKELKAREQFNGEKSVLDVNPDSSQKSPLAESFSDPASSDFDDSKTTPSNVSGQEPFHFLNNENHVQVEAHTDIRSDKLDSCTQNVDASVLSENVLQRQQAPKSPSHRRNNLHGFQNLEVSKLEPLPRFSTFRDGGGTSTNCKSWTKKIRPESNESFRQRSKEAVSQSDENKCELMIGSISIPVEDSKLWKKDLRLREAGHENGSELGKHNRNNVDEQAILDDKASVSEDVSKIWRPVSRSETRAQLPAQRGNQDYAEDVMHEMLAGGTGPDGSCLQSSVLGSDRQQNGESSPSPSDVTNGPLGLKFSSVAAKGFLTERWKEAVAGDHVKLVVSQKPGLAGGTTPEFTSISGNAEANIQKKSDNGAKIQHTPKKEVVA